MTLPSLLPYAVDFAIACFAVSLVLNLVLIARGPGHVDRILALDTMAINVLALIVLHGIRSGTALNFEAAMLFAATGFVGTVAYCKYLLRGDIIE
jgi:multicomponent K+:H+ antiporter subunit F